METFRFKIAKIPFQIQTDWRISISDNFPPFFTDETEPFSETIKIASVEKLPPLSEPEIWRENRGETLFEGKRCILHRLTEHSKPFAMEVFRNEKERVLYYSEESGEVPLSMQNIFGGISLEEMLLRNEALLLHTSLIRWEGKGILFSAPSGTGKSTQADLWAKYCGAEIINGDRAVLRKIDGVWTAFGLPFAGSSDIFKNESVPITAVVMLAQGKENILTSLTPAQAIKKILPEVTLHRWDEAFLNKGLDLILNLLGEVSVYRLSCRPDREAVELLRKTITKEVWK